MIDEYTAGAIEPYATFDAPDGEHIAVIDILEGEDFVHLVVLSLPIYGKAKVNVHKVQYRGIETTYIKRFDSNFSLHNFTPKHDDWRFVVND